MPQGMAEGLVAPEAHPAPAFRRVDRDCIAAVRTRQGFREVLGGGMGAPPC